jgi:hypothetical protein
MLFKISFAKHKVRLEIKSGKIGKLRSLHVCMDYAKSDFAIRLHYGRVQKDRVSTPGGKSYMLISLPYFLAAHIEHYLDFQKFSIRRKSNLLPILSIPVQFMCGSATLSPLPTIFAV